MTQPQVAKTKTFGDWAKIAIAKHFNKMLKHEAEVLKDKDPEELHQMRVGMRRLRSAMTGFAPALDLPKAAGEKQVGKIAKTLGTLRDIDVLQETLATQYQPQLPTEEQKCWDQVFKTLKKRRKQAFKQVKASLNSDRYFRLKQSLKDWLQEPSYETIAAIKIELVLPDLLLPQISKLLLHPAWFLGVSLDEGAIDCQELNPQAIEQILVSQAEIMHALRKEAKRTRYNMDLFTQFYGEVYQNYLQKIRELQAVLGQIQDSFVLVEFLESIVESELQKQMPTLAAQLKASRVQKWQEWERLQKYFLEEQKRQDLRTIVQYPE